MDPSLSSRRALIVDDEFIIAFDLESSMRELGFDVCTVASNEGDAIELAKSNLPDVVVMDVYSRRHSYRNRNRAMAARGVWRACCFCDSPQRRGDPGAHSRRCAHCACAVQAGLSTNAGRRGDGGYTLKAWYRGTA
jgi:hypothetical protein